MALNFFYHKNSRKDGTYKKYLENEIEGRKKSNVALRQKIKDIENEIVRNEAEIQRLNKEYSQMGGKISAEYEPPKNSVQANTSGYQPKSKPTPKEDEKTKAGNYGLVFGIGCVTLFFAALLGIPEFAGFVLCAVGVSLFVMMFR